MTSGDHLIETVCFWEVHFVGMVFNSEVKKNRYKVETNQKVLYTYMHVLFPVVTYQWI